VSQIKNGQEITANVHEVMYDAQEGKTYVWLYDTVGPYSESFTAQIVEDLTQTPPVQAFSGQISVKANADSQDVETFIINNVETEKFKPYSGKVLHFVNFDPIERTEDRREKVKLVFDF